MESENGENTTFNSSTPGGHKKELEHNFDLFSICGVGLAAGNSW